MALKAIYDKKEDIPEGMEEHYAEKKGKWELQAEGMKTQADVDRVSTALTKEKDEHKATKEKLRAYDGLEPDQVREQLAEVEELRVRAEAAGKEFPEDKIQAIVAQRVKKEVAPVERERDKLREANTALEARVGQLDGTIKARTVETQVRRAAEMAKVVPAAIDDIVALSDRIFEVQEDGSVVTRDGVGVAPGVGVDVYLSDMRSKRPHWWPASVGGGAGGSDGDGGGVNNPWSAKHWNLTQQGQILRADRAKADQLARAAGVPTTGGVRPAEKK